MSGLRVAVLGATGHVGKALTAALTAQANWHITAFARSLGRLEQFLLSEAIPARAAEINSFESEPFDLVVNATGIGDPSRFGPDARELSRVTAQFDEVLIRYLERLPECRAIVISSGAAYLSDFDVPAGAVERFSTVIPHLRPSDAYGAVKVASERRHRAADRLAIVDLRLFGFFSRFADLGQPFLLNQALSCIRDGCELATDASDVVRDYAHPDDLAALVSAVAIAQPMNRALDVYSAAPASKFEILDLLTEHVGLKYVVDSGADVVSATGRKPNYYSVDRSAGEFGYSPSFTTLACVRDVAGSLVEAAK